MTTNEELINLVNINICKQNCDFQCVNQFEFFFLFPFCSSLFQMKIAGPKMVPFFKAVCVYFVLNAHNHNGELWTTILKCAPIVGLMLFIMLHGINTTAKYVY